MIQTLRMSGLILVMLVAFDLAVAAGLAGMQRVGVADGLVRYFEFGRSVPGKLARWQAEPEAQGNLYDVAWRPDILARSAEDFAAEPADAGPVLRSYGMSFSGNILRQAQALDPDLIVDRHAGPAAPPNMVFELFLADRANRRPGDVVMLTFLSSSVPALQAMSNRTWNFEQPAPFTYPIFRPGPDNGLIRIAPLVESLEEERALMGDSAQATAWQAQLAEEDAFYTAAGFGLPGLDASPFLRLLRRSAATRAVGQRQAEVIDQDAAAQAEILRRMIAEVARIAAEDDQHPIIVLVQGRAPSDLDMLDATAEALAAHDVAYLATVEHFDPRDRAGFAQDGHYLPEVDRRFAAALLDLLPASQRAAP